MYSLTLGRWMQMDPAGYVDGVALYQMVKSNPESFTDPFGLYEYDFHYSVIHLLLRAKCWSEADATAVAEASEAIDENPQTDPMKLGSTVWLAHKVGNVAAERAASKTLADYHFPGSGVGINTKRNDSNSGTHFHDALISGDLQSAERWVHTYADSWAHEGYSAYLPANAGMGAFPGHATVGHTPDQPFNDVGKALDAAAHIYDLIPSKCPCGDSIPWDILRRALMQVFQEHEEDNLYRACAVATAESQLEQEFYGQYFLNPGPP